MSEQPLDTHSHKPCRGVTPDGRCAGCWTCDYHHPTCKRRSFYVSRDWPWRFLWRVEREQHYTAYRLCVFGVLFEHVRRSAA